MSFHSVAINSPELPKSKIKTALLLDDCEFDRCRIKRLNSQLDAPLILEDVPDIHSMNNCLDVKSFDLIMIDYSLGEDDGFSALDMIQKHKLNSDAAKIMISGSTQTDVAVSALKRGCSDFVSKKELTAQKFQASVYEALQKARPDLIENPPNVQMALQDALQDANLQVLVQQAVASVLSNMGPDQKTCFTAYDQTDIFRMVADMIEEDDDFIFR